MKFTTFLMFTGQAEEAMRCYTALLPGSRILDLGVSWQLNLP